MQRDKKMFEYNHRELCRIGANFLKRSESANGHGCHFVIVEPASYGENPDVFGIRHGTESNYRTGTILIEVKTSRPDFLKDKKKKHRQKPETGIGKWRYYLCPENLILAEEVPDRWGLLYVTPGGQLKIIKGAMAVPKQKADWNWGTNPRYIRNGALLEQSFHDHAFNIRNTQNEMNIMTMALAKIEDVENIIYLKRELFQVKNESTNKIFELEKEVRSLQQQISMKNLRESLNDLDKDESLRAIPRASKSVEK